jgi:chemotaxis response regulator CheB
VQVKSDPKRRGAGESVLVFDDNPAIRKLLAYAFLSDGFKTCAEAGDGQEAIEVAKQIKPDIVTLDHLGIMGRQGSVLRMGSLG